MISTLFSPWRRWSTWWALVHGLLDVFVGTVFFVPVVVLLSLSIGLIPLLPLAVAAAWLLFAVAQTLGRVQRSRVAALLGLEIPDPHLPLRPASWLSRLLERARTPSRWREIACFLLLPVYALTFALTAITWCGSVALLLLPTYAGSLPGQHANFGLFSVGPGPWAALAAATGLVGLVVLAPWLTVAIAAGSRALAQSLLGPSPNVGLRREVRQLEARRAAAVDTAETERRRIERDLHDGAQQRLVSLAMDLGQASERFDTDIDKARELVVEAHQEAKAVLADLRHLVRGLHPAILADRGLDAALSAVVARCPVPVALQVDVAERPSAAIESTAYFTVTEALTNVAKHARATKAAVSIARAGDRLVVEVTDDGVGGAAAQDGSGLQGLSERIASVGGSMRILSPSGGPTTLLVELPCAS